MKAGKKRVVNVDEVLRADGCDELVREHLHVARQHDQAALVLADERELFLFGFALVLLRDGHDEIGNVVEVGDPLVVGMIGNDQWNLAAQFAALVAVEKILQAMVVLGDEDGDAGAVGGVGEPPVHLEFAGDGSEALGELREIEIEIGDGRTRPASGRDWIASSPCSSVNRMLPLWRKMKSAIEATTPLRSGQETRRMAELCMRIR